MRRQSVVVLEASIWLAVACLSIYAYTLLGKQTLPFVPLESPKPPVCTETLYKSFKLIGVAGDRLVLHSSVQNKIRFAQKASPENFNEYEVKGDDIRYQHPYVMYMVTKGIKRHDVVCKYGADGLTTIYDKERAGELRHCRNEGIDKSGNIWLSDEDCRLGSNLLHLININDGELVSIKLHEKLPTKYNIDHEDEDEDEDDPNIYHFNPVLGVIISERADVFSVYQISDDSISITKRNAYYAPHCHSWPLLYVSSEYVLLREYQGLKLFSHTFEEVHSWYAEPLEEVSYNRICIFKYDNGDLLLLNEENIYYYYKYEIRHSFKHNMGSHDLAFEAEDSIIYQDASGKIIEVGFDLQNRELLKVSPNTDFRGGILVD